MEEVTGSYVKDAVIRKIALQFPGVKVYEENAQQGLSQPCFLVFEINVVETKALDKARERTHQMAIRWIPKDETPRKYNQCANVGNALLRCLELVETDTTPLRANSISYRIEQDVLLFEADYDFRIAEATETPKQRELDLSTATKPKRGEK